MKSCSILLTVLVLGGSVLGVFCQRNGFNWGGWEGGQFNPEGPIFGQGPPRQPSQFNPRPRPTAAPVSPSTEFNPGLDGNRQLIGCPCLSTPEVNLACGTDGNAYGNMAKLRCAQRCCHNVQLAHLGNCRARDLLTAAQRRATRLE